MLNSQRSDTEKINLIEKGEKIGTDRLLNRMKLLLKVKNIKYNTMSSYFLKCRKMRKV